MSFSHNRLKTAKICNFPNNSVFFSSWFYPTSNGWLLTHGCMVDENSLALRFTQTFHLPEFWHSCRSTGNFHKHLANISAMISAWWGSSTHTLKENLEAHMVTSARKGNHPMFITRIHCLEYSQNHKNLASSGQEMICSGLCLTKSLSTCID